MNFKKRVNRHREMAMKVLESSENARNNDWSLIFDALSIHGVEINYNTKIDIITSGVNVHTLVRERRRIQKTGLFLPTNPTVAKKRRLLAADYAEHYSE